MSTASAHAISSRIWGAPLGNGRERPLWRLLPSEEGFIGLAELAGFFATESRHHMLDADYLSSWYPRRARERLAYLELIGKTSPFWLGTPDPGPSR